MTKRIKPAALEVASLSAKAIVRETDGAGFPLMAPITVIRIAIAEGDVITAFDLSTRQAIDFASHVARIADETPSMFRGCHPSDVNIGSLMR